MVIGVCIEVRDFPSDILTGKGNRKDITQVSRHDLMESWQLIYEVL